MKKQYSSPTYSSNQKALPQANMRERIVRLTETVNDLRSNVEIEAQNQDSLEKLNSKNYTLVSTQIKALKKAFNTLADVIMEELDSIKSEIFRDFQDSNSTVYRKVDDLTTQMVKFQNEKQEQKDELVTLEQELRDRISNLERRDEENIQIIQSIAEASKEDHKSLFEKFNGMIKANNAKLETLAQENERLSKALEDTRRKMTGDSSSINELYNKIAHVEENVKRQDQEIVTKLNETKNQTVILKETIKGEIHSATKGQTDFVKKLEEMTAKLNDHAQAQEIASQKRFSELEELINQVQQEFHENIQELAKIHKESSTQIIVDFEKAMNSINNDNKVIYKKFAVLESSVIKSREELGTMITDHEHAISKKIEQFNRAFFDICRQMNISNPLLSY